MDPAAQRSMASAAEVTELLTAHLARYRSELLDDIVPFWMRHAEDKTNGGIYTCISDHGAVVQGDKWLWSQFRAVWVFAKLFNSFTAPDLAMRRAEWLRLHPEELQTGTNRAEL